MAMGMFLGLVPSLTGLFFFKNHIILQREYFYTFFLNFLFNVMHQVRLV